MKPIAILCTLVLLLAPLGQANATGAAAPGRVTLTADMVQSAVDIESAIEQATAGGTRPGVVILDGSGGAFEYAPQAEDVDINIYVSDLTLRGVNGAALHGGGLTLDGMPLRNIMLRDLEMHCPQDCITSPDGLHRNVSVRGNTLHAGAAGIAVGNTSGWRIEDNIINAGGDAIHLVSVTRTSVVNNLLAGYIAVKLGPGYGCQVTGNTIVAEWQGILLAGDSQGNLVTANAITGVEQAGISLEPGTLDNKVHGNRVLCAACQTVEDDGTDNHVSGNRP